MTRNFTTQFCSPWEQLTGPSSLQALQAPATVSSTKFVWPMNTRTSADTKCLGEKQWNQTVPSKFRSSKRLENNWRQTHGGGPERWKQSSQKTKRHSSP